MSRLDAALARMDDLLQLSKPVCWGDLVQALEAEGHCAIVLLLAVPFVVPLLPGMSSPVGFAVMVLGVGYVSGRAPWIPRRFANRTLPREGVRRIVAKCRQWRLRAGRWLRPRGTFVSPRARRIGVGSLFALMGAELALPIPFPGTNTLPALSLLILAMGALEGDELWLAAGSVLALMATLYILMVLGSPVLLLKWWR